MSAFNNLLDMQPEKLHEFEDATKLITPTLRTYLYRVDYSYKTVRHNFKKSFKLLVLNEEDKDEVKYRFIEHINSFNKTFPHRKLSNVEILDITLKELDLRLL